MLKQGAVDYLCKPFEPELLLAKLRALEANCDVDADAPACSNSSDLALSDWIANQERGYIQRVLEANNWRVQDTAKLLCISRKTLWEKMKRLEIQSEKIGGQRKGQFNAEEGAPPGRSLKVDPAVH